MNQDAKALLWLAVEDYSGLWEAVWELRSLHPQADPDELIEASRAVLVGLLRDGLIELYRCVEPYGDTTPVADADAPALLEAPKGWDVPEDGVLSVRFTATAAGEALTVTR
jgi:hypothetical protein